MKKQINRLDFAFFSMLLFSACTSLSSKPLTPEEQAVKMIDPSQLIELKSCKPLDKIVASGHQDNNISSFILQLKRLGASMGGNVVMSKLNLVDEIELNSKGERVSVGKTTQGKAFSCPPPVLLKLHNSEEL